MPRLDARARNATERRVDERIARALTGLGPSASGANMKETPLRSTEE